jgi:autonomous glycyl radical cofactor GrcA
MSRPENENSKEQIEKTARELRKHRPHPSEALVARIERLAECGVARRAHSARIQVSRRRLVFALAAALAVAVAGGIVAGELQHSSKTVASGRPQKLITAGKQRGSIATSDTQTSRAQKHSATYSAPSAGAVQFEEKAPTSSSAASGAGLVGSDATSTTSRNALAKIPLTKRLADLHAVLMLKVDDRSQLSDATAKAMKIARSLGGYIASAHYQSPSGGVAISTLRLKVPATHAQDALTRISELGEILSQKVSLEDVQRTVTVEGDQIKTLQGRIADLERSLSDSSLTPSARSQLQVQLANARANLHSIQAQRSANVRRGRLATITLTLTTGDLPKPAATPSRIHKAIDRAWNGLSSEISWAAMTIIVASPFLLLAALLAVLIRSRRRREERRLLEK